MIKMVNAALQNFIFTVWVNCVVVFLVLIFCLLGIIFGEPAELSLLIKITKNYRHHTFVGLGVILCCFNRYI